MRTKYSFKGNLVRFNGFIIVLMILCDIIFWFKGQDSYFFSLTMLMSFGLVGFLSLWFLPDIYILKDRIEISRLFGLYKIDVSIDKVIVQNKILNIPQYGLIGECPKYSKITIANKPFFLGTFYLISLIRNYEEIMNVLEKKRGCDE